MVQLLSFCDLDFSEEKFSCFFFLKERVALTSSLTEATKKSEQSE